MFDNMKHQEILSLTLKQLRYAVAAADICYGRRDNRLNATWPTVVKSQGADDDWSVIREMVGR